MLAVIGMTRRGMTLAAALRHVPTAIVAAFAATATTVAISPVGPVGVCGLAETDPAMLFDWLVIAIGAPLVESSCRSPACHP